MTRNACRSLVPSYPDRSQASIGSPGVADCPPTAPVAHPVTLSRADRQASLGRPAERPITGQSGERALASRKPFGRETRHQQAFNTEGRLSPSPAGRPDPRTVRGRQYRKVAMDPDECRRRWHPPARRTWRRLLPIGGERRQSVVKPTPTRSSRTATNHGIARSLESPISLRPSRLPSVAFGGTRWLSRGLARYRCAHRPERFVRSCPAPWNSPSDPRLQTGGFALPALPCAPKATQGRTQLRRFRLRGCRVLQARDTGRSGQRP